MVERVGHILLGNGVVAAGLALIALFLGARRDVYLFGLAAAIVGLFIALPTGMTLESMLPANVTSILLPLIAPLIEEPLRVGFLSFGAATFVRHERAAGTALAFAFGYALFESTVKTFDLLAEYWGRLSFKEWLAVLSTPLVVLALHLSLSLVAAMMFAKGFGLRVVSATTVALHAIHNASVIWMPRVASLDTMIQINVLRVLIFWAVIRYCLSALRPGPTVAA